MTSRNLLFALFALAPGTAVAQIGRTNISVSPAVVSVAAQGSTTAILTFSGLSGASSYAPAEGLWCGRVVASRCDPSTIYGQAPAASAFAVSAGGTFMDVMSVPPSVAQRAYEAVRAGQPALFFYVRHFVASGATKAYGPDQYVAVSCKLGGGGANAPFALTNVRLHLVSETPVLFVKRGDTPPPLQADIVYTGTGRLRGRWEIVLPGEDLPSPSDLLTEGSLPPAQRGLQRRYRELQRFNVMLLPTGRFTLPGPDPERLPTPVDRAYTILLRIEASDDPFSDTQVAGAAGTATVIHNGAAAGFPMPTLRYIVGGFRTRQVPPAPQYVRLKLPNAEASVSPDSALTLSWVAERGPARYRVEIERAADGVSVLSAIVAPGAGVYPVPPFVLGQVPDGKVRWRIVALDADGKETGHSEWRRAQRRPRP
jgi:hypothetical protein